MDRLMRATLPSRNSAGECGSYGNQPWFCLASHPGKEYLARRHLREQGYETFVPSIVKQREKRRALFIRPLFPGYLFVAFDPQQSGWKSIQFTMGVKYLFKLAESSPAQMDQRMIEGLLRETDNIDELGLRQGGVSKAELDEVRVDETPFIKPGTRVRVKSGPMAGSYGICTMKDRQRVNLLILILNRHIEVEFTGEAMRQLAPDTDAEVA